MDEAVRRVTRLKLEALQLLEDLSAVPDGVEPTQLENACSAKLKEMDEALDQLRFKVSKATPDVRETYKPKFDQLRFDCDAVRQSYQACLRRRQELDRDKRDREELLASNQAQLVDTTAIFIDPADLDHHSRLQQANGGVENLISQGASILSDLADQRESLKRVQRRFLDIGNRLGLSNTVMRLIEQRSTQDKYLVLGGIAVASLVMWLVYYYFG